ncbi:MAG TPA: hypothetical protein VHS06_07480 [Chloroflexota bacterium]|nr:hypothetical protein [Chloroflexota bacterium]
MLARHGMAPFLAAAGTSQPLFAGLIMLARQQHDAFSSLLGLSSFVGLVICVADRKLLMPIWFISTFLLDSRTAHTTANVPIALLAGMGLAHLLTHLIHTRTIQTSRGDSLGLARHPAVQIVLAILLAQAMLSDLTVLGPRMQSLSREEREAMSWIADNTPISSTFAVVTSIGSSYDSTSEWFPTQAHRVSVATAQGYEWLGTFDDRLRWHWKLQQCGTSNADCLDHWMGATGAAFTHVYVAGSPSSENRGVDPRGALRDSLARDPRYTRVHDGPGATVFRRVNPEDPIANGEPASLEQHVTGTYAAAGSGENVQ